MNKCEISIDLEAENERLKARVGELENFSIPDLSVASNIIIELDNDINSLQSKLEKSEAQAAMMRGVLKEMLPERGDDIGYCSVCNYIREPYSHSPDCKLIKALSGDAGRELLKEVERLRKEHKGIERMRKLHSRIYHALCDELYLGQPMWEDAAEIIVYKVRQIYADRRYFEAVLQDISQGDGEPIEMAGRALKNAPEDRPDPNVLPVPPLVQELREQLTAKDEEIKLLAERVQVYSDDWGKECGRNVDLQDEIERMREALKLVATILDSGPCCSNCPYYDVCNGFSCLASDTVKQALDLPPDFTTTACTGCIERDAEIKLRDEALGIIFRHLLNNSESGVKIITPGAH
jgi:hypothetical protein